MICKNCQSVGQAFGYNVNLCGKCYSNMKIEIATLTTKVSLAKQIYAGHYHVKPTLKNIMKALDGETFMDQIK